VSQDEAHARHLAQLGFLQNILREQGLPAALVERSAQTPYHTLLVDLETERETDPRQMAVNFYPADPELVADTLLLQYFIALPGEWDEAAAERVRAWLPQVNIQIVLGHFSLSDAAPYYLHFRYVQTLPAAAVISAEAVNDVVLLVTYTPRLFGGPLAGLAAGTLSLAEARAQVTTPPTD
jgi:hypothetical protein